jgi:2,3-bisphosphoglycerate-dependent phosphoglycerate mutase
MQVLLIRHAQSVGNQEKRMQGHGDFSLSARGRDQCQRLGQRLRREAWYPTQIYSSPLRRAWETTAEVIRACQREDEHPGDRPTAHPTIPSPTDSAIAPPPDTWPTPIADADLCEFQNGIFQGLTWAEAKAQYPELCAQLESTPDWLPIPEAETPLDARVRSRRFWDRLFAETDNGDRVWVISHSWILQHLIAELLGCDRTWRIHSTNTGLFEFHVDRDRWEPALTSINGQISPNRYNTELWKIRRFDDAQHLHTDP